MAGRVPKRMAGPAQLTAAAATQYTVGTSRIGIIRKIHFFNADTVTRSVTASIGADAAGTRIADGYSVATKDYLTLWGPWTLAAAEILQAFADVTLKVVITVDGEEEILL